MAALPLLACVSTLDGGPQERTPSRALEKPASLCAGQTPATNTPWQVDKPGVVHVDVDTSACGLTGDPLYFTSLGGRSRHWITRGATSIYKSSQHGFRVVVLRPEAEEIAFTRDWHVNWMARPNGIHTQQLCTGRAFPDASEPHEKNGIRFRVDLGQCGFKKAPVLLTSLGGDEGHALTRGASSVYWADKQRFTVFVQKRGITPADAKAWNWHVNWLAVPEASDDDYCAGKSAPGATNWVEHGENSLLAQMTTPCQAPLVFTSVGGEHSHWFAMGTSSISNLDGARFDLKLSRYQATPEFANREGWHVHWMRVNQTLDSAAPSPSQY